MFEMNKKNKNLMTTIGSPTLTYHYPSKHVLSNIEEKSIFQKPQQKHTLQTFLKGEVLATSGRSALDQVAKPTPDDEMTGWRWTMSKVCHRKWNVYSGTGPTPSLSPNFPTQIHQVHTFPRLNFTLNSENLTKFTLFTSKNTPEMHAIMAPKVEEIELFTTTAARNNNFPKPTAALSVCVC